MTAIDWFALALLGGCGAVLRHAVDGWVERRSEAAFPFGTLVINVSGAFALGVMTGAHVSSSSLFVGGTGLIGSFTTYSTWMFETQRLTEQGEHALATWNIAITLFAGLAAGGAGWALGSTSRR